MAPRSHLWLRLMGAMLVLALAANGHANIWLDENFEGDEAFVQLMGDAPGESGWDSYAADPLIDWVTLTGGYTETGTVTDAKAFQGEKSYRLQTGQALAVGREYQDPQNGNFQIFQFAINVDPIPAEGTVATFRWGHNINPGEPDPDYSFYVRLDSDGDVVTIHGGEDETNDPPLEAVLGTLDSTDDWTYITVLSQKAPDPTPDSRFPFLGAVDRGVHFFNQSQTASHFVPYVVSEEGHYFGREWSFTVESGTIYLDELYWDGGMDDNLLEDSRFRPFDLGGVTPPTAQDWMIIQ